MKHQSTASLTAYPIPIEKVKNGYDYIIRGLYYEACKLYSAVTSIDKLLWFGIWTYYYYNQIISDNEYRSEHYDMMFALIYLLKKTQKKEILYKRTINAKSISSKTNLLKLIEADWDKVDKEYLSKLTDCVASKLIEINESVAQLSEKVEDDYVQQKKISDKTRKEWHQFLNILNDLSSRERDVIFQINRATSPRDKTRIINGYQSILRNINRNKYMINDEEVSLLQLFSVINERMTKAPLFCTVKTDNGKSFQLHPAALVLAMEPKTFNYLLISFHEFRLTPRKDTAKRFVALALSTIKKNLGEPIIEHVSLDETIDDFYRTVMGFVKNNSSAIESLSFDSLREDSAIIAGKLSHFVTIDGIKDNLAKGIKDFENSAEYEKELEKMITGGGRMLTAEEVGSMFQSIEKQAEHEERVELAGRIVTSLNIIYMFCDALRIMISNRHASINVKDRENVEKYRRDLLLLDDNLVHRVYANLDSSEIGMLEYREKSGIITTSLSEQESEEENYRNSLFGDVLKNAISSLVDSIENKDAEEVLKTKAFIREEILRYPDCDEKERYTGWLDDISRRISDVLIVRCQKEDYFQKIKDNLLSSLGVKADILPDSTVNSLTTAEMLYARYASEEYADKGFDFSCISALYYQAFEEAYNILIWREYADKLNVLVINGQKYTEIIERCKGKAIEPRDARGYLNPDPKQRNYYIEYHNVERQETKVSMRCMYKSFAILLQNIKPSSVIEHFCDYIAMKTGFSNRHDMFNDPSFMRNCYAFTAAVDASAYSRNNASHGGTFISIEQCKTDRKTVLSELEAVRSDSLGLIQQLIFLLSRASIK